MIRTPVLLLSCACLMCGCSLYSRTTPPALAQPTTLTATIKASRMINVGVMGRPSPVVVRIYQLKGTTAFEAADFLSLFERERETLGGELVERHEMVLRPGDRYSLAAKLLNADTRAIGAAVAFQDIEHAAWRATVPVWPNAANTVAIRIDGATLAVTAIP